MLSEIFANRPDLSGWYAKRYSKKTEVFPDHLIATYGLAGIENRNFYISSDLLGTT